ncbi:MAG TPA: ferritin-like domain-containing protein [Solirubrobacteraceae bacterium]|jgi:rubrerythrin
MSPDRLLIRDGEADTAVIAEYERSRRELVRRGMVAAGAVLAASTVPLLVRVRNAFAQADDDAAILRAAIEIEQAAVEAYQRSQAQLGGVARLFRNQERQHLELLTASLRQMGGTPPSPDVASQLKGLAGAGGRRDRALFAVELENAAVRAYEDAHRSLRDARLMQVATSILGNEAQHLVVLRQIAGREPVPSAFERGRG